MRACVVGLGYIGLPAATALANAGIETIGVDIDPKKLESLSSGVVPFVEPGLQGQLELALADNTLSFSSHPVAAEYFVIAVPTPVDDSFSADLSFVLKAARSIAEVLSKGDCIVIESTCPPGTSGEVVDVIREARPDLAAPSRTEEGDYFLAYCPERVLPGKVVKELISNDRTVGGISPESARVASLMYKQFVEGDIFLTDAATAETVKLVENSFRDTNIAFANQVAGICDEIGINVWEVIELANRHPRVNVLNPGPGVGGHCIAVDPWFLHSAAPHMAELIASARKVNDSRPDYFVEKIKAQAGLVAGNATVAVLGLAFKADVDDLRESPALQIARTVADELEACILVVEPNIDRLPPSLSQLSHVELATLPAALEKADVIALLVDHAQFRNVPTHLLADKAIIDTRGLWSSSS